MANVNIKFNGKDYLLSCDDGQEESLKKLTIFLDNKYSELKSKLGNIGENKLLLITTIKLIDEHFDLRTRVGEQKTKLEDLTSKFNPPKINILTDALKKELKDLINEVLDEREFEKKLNGPYDVYEDESDEWLYRGTY